MLNLCIDPDDEERIRNAHGWDELREACRTALINVQGACLAEIAVVAGVSLGALYVFRRGDSNGQPKTLMAIVSALAPGHPLTASGTCAVRRPPPILPEGWRVHPDNAKYAYKGQEVKKISELVGKVDAA